MTYRDAVLVLADRLPDDLSWAVTASANLALRGFPVEPGDVEHRVDGKWVSTDDVATTREFLTVGGRDVPVMPVDHELRGYRELGREERVALIEAHR